MRIKPEVVLKPKDVMKIIREVVVYYVRNRGVGHTVGMLEGAWKTNPLVVVVNPEYQKMLQTDVISLHQIKEHGLVSQQRALAWDNQALYELFASVAGVVDDLGNEVFTLRMDAKEKDKKIKGLENRVQELLHIILETAK